MTPALSRTLWIAWTKQRRSAELASEFGARLYQFGWYKIKPLRYPVALTATLAVLLWHRPKTVFVQNPSIFCATLFVLLKKVFRFRVIVDSHTIVIPIAGLTHVIFEWLTRFIERGADLNIVTNRFLAREIEEHGGKAAILPDKIPSLPPPESVRLPGRKNIVYICSFAADEPYWHVICAARDLDSDTHLTITGDFTRVDDPRLRRLASNVHLTGFLDDRLYAAILHACDAVIVLTSVPHCMLCGAYEAIAAGKPLITSDHVVLREYFSQGTIHTDNSINGVRDAIETVLMNEKEMQTAVVEMRQRLQTEWRGLLRQVQAKVPR